MYFKGNYTDNYCGACLKGRYHKYGRPESNCRKRYGICIYRWEFTYKNLHSGRTKGSVVYWENPIGNAIIRLRVGPGCRCLISTFSKIQSVIFQLLVLLMLHWLKEHAAPFWTKQYLQLLQHGVPLWLSLILPSQDVDTVEYEQNVSSLFGKSKLITSWELSWVTCIGPGYLAIIVAIFLFLRITDD